MYREVHLLFYIYKKNKLRRGKAMSSKELENVQESLLDLINLEHSIVSKINEVNAELIKAKRFNLRTNEYTKLLEKNTKKLEEVRNSIRIYLQTKIKIMPHDFDMIYDEDDK